MNNKEMIKKIAFLILGIVILLIIAAEAFMITSEKKDSKSTEAAALVSNSDKGQSESDEMLSDKTSEEKADETLEADTSAVTKAVSSEAAESENSSSKNSSTETAESERNSESSAEYESNNESSAESKSNNESSALSDLKQKIQSMTSEYEGDFSVLVQDVNTGDQMTIADNTPKKAASLIKLFVMETIYNQISLGNMKETEEISILLNKMITVSDNESCNKLVELLGTEGSDFESGMKVVNDYIKSQGYTGTSMGRTLQDTREIPAEGENYTTVADCGQMLSKIYHKTCVDEASSEKMYDFLLEQTRQSKIPEGIPAGVLVANKTGELDDTQSDVAIVEDPDKSVYILCIIGADVKNDSAAIAEIADISKVVFQYFKDHEQ